MPSPFPGMDPYLEGSLWMSIHTDLAVAIAHQLNHRMSSRYVALTARRYVVDTPEEAGVLIGEVYPDAAVLTTRPTDATGIVTETIDPPLRMTTLVRTPHTSHHGRDPRPREATARHRDRGPLPDQQEGRGIGSTRDRREKFLRSSAHSWRLTCCARDAACQWAETAIGSLFRIPLPP